MLRLHLSDSLSPIVTFQKPILELLKNDFLDEFKRRFNNSELFSSENIKPSQLIIIDKDSEIIIFKHSFSKENTKTSLASMSYCS